MEQRDIDEEQALTGTYISIDAGDVESAIDPRTGKNITITGECQRDAALIAGCSWVHSVARPSPDEVYNHPRTITGAKKEKEKARAGTEVADERVGPSWLPNWLSSFLNDAPRDDDQDFWDPPDATEAPSEPKGGGGSPSAGGSDGGVDGADGDGGGGDDDTSGIDALNDLLG